MAGNVWEWTNSCYERRAVEAGGGARLLTRNCHVRALEGEHRILISDFIRDAVAAAVRPACRRPISASALCTAAPAPSRELSVASARSRARA